MTVASVIVLVLSVTLVSYTLLSAVRTVILPRGETTLLGLALFRPLLAMFRGAARRCREFTCKDRVMALYAPIALVLLPGLWVTLILIGFMGVFWAVGGHKWDEAFLISGSSLLTLGFAEVDTVPQLLLVFLEATLGLGIVALLITFLPSMYQAFSRREALVGLLEVRAGSPPSAEEYILRAHRIAGLQQLNVTWTEWERWFVEIEESHISYPALVFFRSPRPDQSWITATGTVLDAASLTLAAVDIPWEPSAPLCIRAGYIALRQIGGFFGVPFDPDPAPDDPIAISRREFEAAVDRLEADGVPVKADREQAWRDFAGWRVNYDASLLGLAQLLIAPEATWSADRAPVGGS